MLRLAIIGMGVMGKNHYRVVKQIPGVRVAALCEKGEKDETGETGPGGTYPEPMFREVDDLLATVEVDAAIIAVPTFLHADYARKCIDKGIHLLVEKPLAATAEEGSALLEAARARGIRLAVGHTERFNPVIGALIRELAGKDLFSIQITRVGPFPPRIADVGVLTDLSVHDIDLIRYISKREILETSIHKSKKIHNHHEDNAILSFTLERNVVAGITTNWLTPFKKRKVEVATAEAYYEADLMTQQLIEYSAYSLNNSFIHRDCFVPKAEPLLSQDAAFLRFVETGEAGDRTRGELALAADGLRTLEIIQNHRNAR
jgi:predicted dehydrogenase